MFNCATQFSQIYSYFSFRINYYVLSYKNFGHIANSSYAKYTEQKQKKIYQGIVIYNMSIANLQNFVLNILKKTKHITVQNIKVTELTPCSECDKKNNIN
jgi:hypothetical protein